MTAQMQQMQMQAQQAMEDMSEVSEEIAKEGDLVTIPGTLQVKVKSATGLRNSQVIIAPLGRRGGCKQGRVESQQSD